MWKFAIELESLLLLVACSDCFLCKEVWKLSVKAEIKRFCIWDDKCQDFVPEDPDCCGTVADLSIGPRGEEGGDIFKAYVCTPRWFEENIMAKRPTHPTEETVHNNIFGRHYLFVHSFDETEIRNEIEELVARVSGGTWNTGARLLSRYLAWEYEDNQH